MRNLREVRAGKAVRTQLVRLTVEGLETVGAWQTRFIPVYATFLLPFIDDKELAKTPDLMRNRICREWHGVEDEALGGAEDDEVGLGTIRATVSTLNGLAERAPKLIRRWAAEGYKPREYSLTKAKKDYPANALSTTDNVEGLKLFWRNKVMACLADLDGAPREVRETVLRTVKRLAG